MAFLRSSISLETGPVLRSPGHVLRPPVMADYAAWAELRAASREHLTPWEPTWSRDELTRQAFRRRLRHYQREQREDLGLALLILAASDERLVGGLTLTNIRRGVTQAAQLGYWIGAPFARQGRMSEAVATILAYAERTLRLHRIDAACLPANVASMRVLEHNGFEREGYARRYLKIDGDWRDHVLYGRILGEGSGAAGLASGTVGGGEA